MAADVPDDEVVVGRIIRPWGSRGQLLVESHTDSPLRFSPGSILTLLGCPVRVETCRNIKSNLLITLNNVTDRAGAELLRDHLLTVPKHQISPLPAHTYYYYQIIDMDVWGEGGEYLGKVKEVLSTGGTDVYVVAGTRPGELLLPAVADVVREISVADNKMIVRLPEHTD